VRTLLDAGWMISSFLKYGGLAVALGGVAIFGWYFVGANARAAQRDGDQNSVAWGGAGAMLGIKVLAVGVAVQLASFVLRLLLPGRL